MALHSDAINLQLISVNETKLSKTQLWESQSLLSYNSRPIDCYALWCIVMYYSVESFRPSVPASTLNWRHWLQSCYALLQIGPICRYIMSEGVAHLSMPLISIFVVNGACSPDCKSPAVNMLKKTLGLHPEKQKSSKVLESSVSHHLRGRKGRYKGTC